MTYYHPWELGRDGVQTRLRDNEDGTFTIEYRADVTAHLEQNKRKATHYTRNFAQTPGVVADIPNPVILDMLAKEGANVLKMRWDEIQAFCKRRLNDPEYRYLRVNGVIV